MHIMLKNTKQKQIKPTFLRLSERNIVSWNSTKPDEIIGQ